QAGITVRVLDTADPDEIARGAHDADALLIGYSVVDEALLGRLNRVRLVATQAVGVDTGDLDACRRRGIAVSNVPAAGTEEVAAHAFAMSLAMLRGLPMLDRQVRDGGWDGTVEQLRRPSEVTVGVLGLGRIGRAYIEYIKPVVGGVLGFDPYAEAPPGVAQLDLDDVIRRSDLLSLHLPLTPDTADLIDEARLSLLPPGACIVNVARRGPRRISLRAACPQRPHDQAPASAGDAPCGVLIGGQRARLRTRASQERRGIRGWRRARVSGRLGDLNADGQAMCAARTGATADGRVVGSRYVIGARGNHAVAIHHGPEHDRVSGTGYSGPVFGPTVRAHGRILEQVDGGRHVPVRHGQFVHRRPQVVVAIGVLRLTGMPAIIFTAAGRMRHVINTACRLGHYLKHRPARAAEKGITDGQARPPLEVQGFGSGDIFGVIGSVEGQPVGDL